MKTETCCGPDEEVVLREKRRTTILQQACKLFALNGESWTQMRTPTTEWRNGCMWWHHAERKGVPHDTWCMMNCTTQQQLQRQHAHIMCVWCRFSSTRCCNNDWGKLELVVSRSRVSRLLEIWRRQMFSSSNKETRECSCTIYIFYTAIFNRYSNMQSTCVQVVYVVRTAIQHTKVVDVHGHAHEKSVPSQLASAQRILHLHSEAAQETNAFAQQAQKKQTFPSKEVRFRSDVWWVTEGD